MENIYSKKKLLKLIGSIIAERLIEFDTLTGIFFLPYK